MPKPLPVEPVDFLEGATTEDVPVERPAKQKWSWWITPAVLIAGGLIAWVLVRLFDGTYY